MNELKLFAPAKINLSLKVIGRREDGYHELETLIVPLSIGDSLHIQEAPSGFEGTCPSPQVPMGEGSLLERAFRYASAKLAYKRGLFVQLMKEIPIGAGLGGGSSDAAIVMRTVETLSRKRLDLKLYPEIAGQLGADIPFFLAGSPSWVTGIGERVQAVGDLPTFYLLLVNPGISISTRWVYENLKNWERKGQGQLTSSGSADSLPPLFETLEALSNSVTNDLESVVLPRYPVIREIKERMDSLGGDAALMSGSGSTVFGLFSQKEERDRALEILKREHPDWWVVGAEPSGVVQW